MKKLSLIFFILSSTLLYTVRCVAQSGAAALLPESWSLAQCIEYARQHNIQVNSLQYAQQSAEQNVIAAKGEKIPLLSASVANNLNNANNNVRGNGNLVNQLTSSGAYAVNSSVVLWNDNSVNNTIRRQDLSFQSAGLSVQQAQNNVTLAITQAYLNVLLAKENEKYVSELVHNTDSAVLQSKQLFEAGKVAKISLLQIQAQLASDKYLLVQAQNTIRLNTLTLKQLLQLSTETPFEIAQVPAVNAAAAIAPVAEAQQLALQNFPEIKIGKLAMDISTLDIAIAKAAFKPTIKATGALGSGYSDVLLNSVNPKTSYFRQTGNNFYQSMGVSVAIPIFAQRQNKTNLEKARIAYKQSGLKLQSNQLVLTQAVEQAYLNAVNARQAYDAASQQLTAATESYRIVYAELKLGALNVYDLLQQRNQYVQAVQAFTQAKYTAVLQQKVYQFYMGTPITL
ncbi:MAG: TolC family protein [Bacteroidetes bacterium]|nr:TolC family protein [Bacteroidota bacterium]